MIAINTNALIYSITGGILLISGMLIGKHFENKETEAVKTEYTQFVARTKAEGEIATRNAQIRNTEFERLKDEQDKLYEARVATLSADVKRLRYKTSTTRSYLPEATGSASDTKRVCFDRTKLDQSIRDFDTAIQRLIEKGDSDGLGLTIARDWVKQLESIN
jgi:phage I-like protein